MQCKDVEQADVIEKFMPLILYAVARFAETVEDIVFGTANGPMRLVAPVVFNNLVRGIHRRGAWSARTCN